MSEATLLFGVGATKAGTSWLRAYLAGHPSCHLRTINELHFFDALEQGRLARERAELRTLRDDLAARPLPADPDRAARRAQRLADLADWDATLARGDEAAYLAFLEKGREARPVVADITPAYALLPVERLRRMAALVADVRFVYLMRDPVDRLWSHVRMIARRRAEPGEAIGPRAGRILARVLAGEETHIAVRGDYRAALTRLWAAIDPARLFLGFYEDLFSEACIARLCGFLGIAPVPAAFDLRVHAGVPVPMRRDQRRAAADFLAPQYEFVAARLGRVPAAWQPHRVGV